ncbi:DUF1707 SHOCT-like domain-containing protein [Streptomyces griseoviridis]|uniref:DUF1707 SHOCT-like domain-containing protein n=1 Tax=Streptomyces griseoviridis TaxID=45398 RepID=UPI00345337F2
MDLHKRAPQAQTPPAVAELRASDADRDRIADILRDALAEGRLTAEEHAERVEEVYLAKTVGQLDLLVQDLPAAHQRRQPPTFAPAPERTTRAYIPADPDDNVVAVFSSAVRRGRWRAGRRIHAYAVFGSVEIDLSESLFEHQQILVKALSVFGSIDVRVPENVSLRGTGGGVLGSFEVDHLDAADPNAPVVHVEGWSVLGSIEARPKRGRLVADILDRVQRKIDKVGLGDRSLRKHPDR